MFLLAVKVLIALLMSFIFDIPDNIIILILYFDICSRKGIVVISDEDILIVLYFLLNNLCYFHQGCK